ncbi:hypothetical protein [Microbispora sp. H10830]|uniref:arsenate reductase/protein-tyrosine-phosphatase family protein n=1 Tax=Microbispora sp. H10830 TaxID=2729109 RepID=UPI0037C50F4E
MGRPVQAAERHIGRRHPTLGAVPVPLTQPDQLRVPPSRASRRDPLRVGSSTSSRAQTRAGTAEVISTRRRNPRLPPQQSSRRSCAALAAAGTPCIRHCAASTRHRRLLVGWQRWPRLAVLFACTGNSARSPIAEVLLRQDTAGGVTVTSAGSRPDRRSRRR